MKNSLVLASLIISLCNPAAALAEKSNLSSKNKDQEIVVFNQKSHKYHSKDCKAAKSCKNCVEISRKKAKEAGAEACKLCSGGD
ncbi:MAG: hypothetical protein K2X27_04665 [Candidatus Obscuribacterales bacterium]|nr:hypothetical protein [Candidatus Obscuribacterales bacterium]